MSTSPQSGDACIETPLLSHLSDKDYAEVYEPAEDSFLLLDALEDDLKFIKERNSTICLEIGCGSGVISTAVARALGSTTFCLAVDLNPAACFATRRTAQKNGVSVEVIMGDLTSPLLEAASVDLLIFNPPYVPTASAELTDPDTPLALAWAGGERGREVIDRMLPKVSGLLSSRGLFYLVVIAANGVEEITDVMASYGFSFYVVRERRVRGEHLMVVRFERKTVMNEYAPEYVISRKC